MQPTETHSKDCHQIPLKRMCRLHYEAF